MPGGGIDEYTKLLLHFDELPLVDSSNSSHSLTNNGVSLTTGKFDSAGDFDNTESDWIEIASSDDFDIQDQDFVIDFWFKGATPGYNWPPIICWNQGGGAGLLIAQLTDNTMYAYIDSWIGGQDWDVGVAKSVGTIDSGTFNHYALVRSGGSYYTFKNGVQVVTWDNSSTLNYPAGSQDMSVGLQRSAEYIKGQLDELRVSVGTDRGWSGGFTPPTEPYSVFTDPNISIGNVNLGNLTIS